MTYAFPPPSPPIIGPWAFVANVLVMLIAFAGAFGIFRRKFHPSNRERLRTSAIVIASVAGISAFGLAFEETRIYMDVYFLLVWLAVGPTCLISLIAQARGVRPTSSLVFGCLAIIGFLVFLCSPAIEIAREAAWRTQCKLNLQQLGRAYITAQTNGPPFLLAPGNPPQSWRTKVFLHDHSPLIDFDLEKPWDDPSNLSLGRLKPENYWCPANFNRTDEQKRFYTAYAAVTGPMTAFPNGTALPFAQFTDGTSNTIAFAEAPGLNIVWTEPRDIDTATQPIGINLPGNSRGHSPGVFSSYHRGGANVLLADGRVQFLSEHINPAVLKALMTATGGDSVNDNDF